MTQTSDSSYVETPKRHSPFGVVKVVAALAEVGGAVVDATVLPSATVIDTVVSEITPINAMG